jgi:hypothetical protein
MGKQIRPIPNYFPAPPPRTPVSPHKAGCQPRTPATPTIHNFSASGLTNFKQDLLDLTP